MSVALPGTTPPQKPTSTWSCPSAARRLASNASTLTVEGRLLSVEQRSVQRGEVTTAVDTIAIVTDAGELRNFELSPSVRVRVVERDLRQEIGRYLDLVGSTREQDVRNMVISTAGTGELIEAAAPRPPVHHRREPDVG